MPRPQMSSGMAVTNRNAEQSEPPSVGRGYGRLLEMLELLASLETPATVSQLARDLGIPKATAGLLVKHLVARRYASYAQDRQLTVGPELLKLSLRVADKHIRGRAAAHAALERIADATGLDTSLAQIVDLEVMYIDRVEGRSAPLNFNIGIGVPRPLHCTAIGKVALAFGPPELWSTLPAKLDRYSDWTITSRAQLEEDIARCRERGYSLVDQEYFEGLLSVGVPIPERAGVRRILVLHAHRSVVADRVPEFVQLLKAEANGLSTDFVPSELVQRS